MPSQIETVKTVPMVWTVPNMLTVGRLLAAPAVALVYAFMDRPWADVIGFWLFALASLTDYLDGWLARRWNQISAIGAMLDPIADKAMVIIALAAILGTNPHPDGGLRPELALPAALIFLREIAVSGLREFLGDVKLPVTKLAKWKTTVQMLALGGLMLAPALGWAGLWETALILLWMAAGLTAATGVDYMAKGMAHIRNREGS